MSLTGPEIQKPWHVQQLQHTSLSSGCSYHQLAVLVTWTRNCTESTRKEEGYTVSNDAGLTLLSARRWTCCLSRFIWSLKVCSLHQTKAFRDQLCDYGNCPSSQWQHPNQKRCDFQPQSLWESYGTSFVWIYGRAENADDEWNFRGPGGQENGDLTGDTLSPHSYFIMGHCHYIGAIATSVSAIQLFGGAHASVLWVCKPVGQEKT